MSKGRTMLYFLLPLTMSAGLAAASLVAPHVSPVVTTSTVSIVAPAAEAVPVAPRSDVPAEARCRFLHRGDQSRSLELAVTGLHAEDDENAGLVLAWTEPSFTLHLDGYEYHGYVAGESSRGTAWIDAGKRATAVMLPASLSGRGHEFEVVARYRYPLPDGHAYYWYGPVASTERTASPNAACGPIFGQPDTTLAVE